MGWASYHSLRDFDDLRREMNRLFENVDSGRWTFPFSRFSFLPGLSSRSYPLIRVSDDGDSLQVEALAPGLDPKSVKVTVVRNQLTVEGEKTATSEGKDAKQVFHRNERATGHFVRTLTLPVEIDADNVKARYENGLLSITLPRSEAARPRQISVNLN